MSEPLTNAAVVYSWNASDGCGWRIVSQKMTVNSEAVTTYCLETTDGKDALGCYRWADGFEGDVIEALFHQLLKIVVVDR